MFPAWLQTLLGIVAIFATFFLLAWLIRREALPPRVQFLGWLSVGITAAGFVGSLWVESLAPALRAHHLRYALLTLAQSGGALLGLVILIGGAVTFLRHWLQWQTTAAPPQPSRWRLVWHQWRQMLLLPGLGWVPFGLGTIIIALQTLDPGLPPDPALVTLGASLIGLGCLLILWQRWAGQ